MALCIHGMARYNRYVRHLQAAALLAAPCMILYIEGSINARNDDGKMMKNGLLKLVLFSGMISLGGCSSVMSHTGGKEGTYPGTAPARKC